MISVNTRITLPFYVMYGLCQIIFKNIYYIQFFLHIIELNSIETVMFIIFWQETYKLENVVVLNFIKIRERYIFAL